LGEFTLKIEDVTILGSGAAGSTAALYAARANLDPLVIEGATPGGQLTITTDVENYPGFAEGIQGPDLMIIFKDQAIKFGARYEIGHVTSVDLSNRPFKITIDEENIVLTQTIIVATGATAKLLGLKSENKLMGRGVSACATCDGFFFKDKEVIVVGGGDTAMEESLFLTKYASKVFVVHRRDQLRASNILQDRAQANDKIEFIWNTTVNDINGVEGNEVTGVTLQNILTGETTNKPIDGVFIAIGHTPNSQLFHGIVDLDENNYIRTLNGSETNIEGIFACGDVQDPIYRQAVTAAGTGCMAAIDAERFLSSKQFESLKETSKV
jgi:thioredoxin reductase (NADPH)